MKKTWIEKYNQPREKTIKILDKDFTDMKAGEKMLIATPQIINKYVNQIPSSFLVDMKTMRKDLALSYNADVTCYKIIRRWNCVSVLHRNSPLYQVFGT